MLNNFKYIKDITDNVGTICIYSQIGDSVDEHGNYSYGISGSSFANEMQYLNSCCDKINVRINSIGGSVFDGYSMVSAILNSNKQVDCYIDGLAASMAGVVAVSGNKCYMADYGTLMLHNPSGGNDKKVLALVKDTLVTILSNRTKQTPDSIDAMMMQETWLNAKQALELGMVDEVVQSNKKIKVPKNSSLYDMALIYNKVINPKNNMTKINTLLKISNEASESEQESAIVNLNKQIEDSKLEIETLKNDLKVLQDAQAARELAAKEALTNKATQLVLNAIKEGKLTEAEKEGTILNASKDEASFEFISNMVSRLGNSKQSQKPFDVNNVKTDSVEDKSKWSYSDWEKKDPSGLKEMYVKDNVAFNELVKTINVKNKK